MHSGKGTDTFTMASGNTIPSFSASEARMWASAVILSGGMVSLSDDISRLNEDGRAMIRTVMRYCGGSAGRALDLSGRIPSLILKQHATCHILGCFNWTEQEQPALDEKWIDAVGAKRWKDAWCGNEYSTESLREALLAPHSCLLLRETSEIPV